MPKSIHLKTSKIVVISQIGELEKVNEPNKSKPTQVFPHAERFQIIISNKTV